MEDLNSKHLHYHRKGEKKKTYFVRLKVKLQKECKLLFLKKKKKGMQIVST